MIDYLSLSHVVMFQKELKQPRSGHEARLFVRGRWTGDLSAFSMCDYLLQAPFAIGFGSAARSLRVLIGVYPRKRSAPRVVPSHGAMRCANNRSINLKPRSQGYKPYLQDT
jgi:hypothetical protein